MNRSHSSYVRTRFCFFRLLALKRNFYPGPLQIYTQGFHDAQTGALITRELRTDSINAGAIARGEVPGWKKLDVTDSSTVRAIDEVGSLVRLWG